MASALVAPHFWAEKFLECPGVNEDIKARVREFAPRDYAEIRSKILAKHGPTRAPSFFMEQLHQVRGTTGTEVSNKLLNLRTLYNRAAEDAGKQSLTLEDLLYCFASAFPSATADALRKQIRGVSSRADPFEELVNLAPDGKTTTVHFVTDTTSTTNPSGAVGPSRSKRQQPLPADIASLTAAVLNQIKRQRPSFDPDFARTAQANPSPPSSNFAPRQGNCSGCGRNCQSRDACPAYGKPCFKCGKMNHFSSVCRNPVQPQNRPQQTRNFRGASRQVKFT